VTGEPPAPRQGDYRYARIGAAAALTGLLSLLLITDALSKDYEAPLPIAFGLILAIGGLLSVDLAAYIKGGTR
jgi:hypothetical protein